MAEYSLEYLELLAEKYPNKAAVCSELINLKAIMSLPKGTEHFISDLHGEYGAVSHILNNCSGVILEKVRMLFEEELGDEGCRGLCSLIYYPHEQMARMRKQKKLDDTVKRKTLERLRLLAETLSGKYTRNYVRRQMPEQWSFVLDELLHIQHDEDENQLRYYQVLLDSAIETGAAEELIAAMAELVKRLAVDRLHIVGDIYDRGPEPARLLDALMDYPNLDIQWGNHDILWMGAAAGSPACVFTALRITMDYGNDSLLERRYGISLRPLTEFVRRVYGDPSKKTVHRALNTLVFKLEGQVIKRHPGYEMDSRLMLERVDFDRMTVRLDSGEYPLNTSDWPTIDKTEPYKLSEEEQELVEEYVSAFRDSVPLRQHIDFIYKNGSTYLCCNGNLLYHGCIPMNADGSFAKVRHGGIWYSGRSLLDHADRVVKSAWADKDESALDMMYYLWCGTNSPFSGREFHTFERGVVDDKSTWEEPKNPYFRYWDDENAARMILREFGLDEESGHIINGHTPVKAVKGESPVKANGKLYVIDGGFCKAYQPTTGIAGYTLIYNSHGIRLKSHRPFEGISKAINNNIDIESDSIKTESFEQRRYISDTDKGKQLTLRIDALKALLEAYRSGDIEEQ